MTPPPHQSPTPF